MEAERAPTRARGCARRGPRSIAYARRARAPCRRGCSTSAPARRRRGHRERRDRADCVRRVSYEAAPAVVLLPCKHLCLSRGLRQMRTPVCRTPAARSVYACPCLDPTRQTHNPTTPIAPPTHRAISPRLHYPDPSLPSSSASSGGRSNSARVRPADSARESPDFATAVSTSHEISNSDATPAVPIAAMRTPPLPSRSGTAEPRARPTMGPAPGTEGCAHGNDARSRRPYAIARPTPTRRRARARSASVVAPIAPRAQARRAAHDIDDLVERSVAQQRSVCASSLPSSGGPRRARVARRTARRRPRLSRPPRRRDSHR